MGRFIGLVLFCITILIFGCQAKAATTFEGLVTKVHDGDTMTVINESGNPETVRLYKVDSPELKGSKWPLQPYAIEARTALSNLCLNQSAIVVRKSISYGRTVGLVSCKGTSTIDYLLLTGNAWAYRGNLTKVTKAMQNEAKTRGVGLWAKPAVEPYLWRRGYR